MTNKTINMDKKHLNATILKLEKLPFNKFKIPKYQRPYRWSEKNVLQLLNDVNKARLDNLSEYRIGSLILHKKDNYLDIVDGQQRITTIALILKQLCENETSYFSDFCSRVEYNHVDSVQNIRSNYYFISQWIEESLDQERENYLSYLSRKCSFVFVEVEEEHLSEAFQMFDSQNGRGKELEAYNLLKAFHLQDMYEGGDNNESDKIHCDKRWEAATRYEDKDILKQVIHEHLFRTRLWGRNTEASTFTKEELDEFKGFSLNQELVDYPFQNIYLLLQNNKGNILQNTSKRTNNSDVESKFNPFISINQPIINGKSFFDYVNTYIEMYKFLFMINKENDTFEFPQFYKTNCLDYNGAKRTGDGYIRQLYKSTIMLLFDKYGSKGVDRYYKALYSIIYRLRLEKTRVYYNTVAKYPLDIFACIINSKHITDMYALESMARRPIKQEMTNVSKEITDFFKNEYNNIEE